MKENKSLKTSRTGLFGSVLTVLAITMALSSCRPDFDLDKRFPEWLGTSIYETLKQGFDGRTFKYYVAIIDSLGEKNVLAKTGSRTLFVADDEAFERFLNKCPLAGNRKIEFKDLTKAQMKMILYGSMLKNVYQVAALSNTPGDDTSDEPKTGDCMRRTTYASPYDTVRIVLPSDMPSTEYWSYLKNDPARAAGIVCFEDGTEKPMVIFCDKFLETKGIKPDDYDFLFNQGAYPLSNPSGKPARVAGEASVNGVKIAQQNKKCFNGFIHVMEDVIYLLPSMAEYIASSDTTLSTGNTSIIYSSILDRFSIPYYVKGTFPRSGMTEATEQLKQIKTSIENHVLDNTPALQAARDASRDSIYTRLYLSKRNRSNGTINRVSSLSADTIKSSSLLKFDPGWNAYFVPSSSSNAIALQQNMAVMIVPTDSAMIHWWVAGAGMEMREKYGLAKYKTKSNNESDWTPREVAEDMSKVDLNVIAKLVNNNMLSSLVSSVPSKFKDVLNDAQDEMFKDIGVEQAKRDICKVAMCCNGAIYFTNYINTPTMYRSVAYPALTSEKLKVMDWAVEDESMGFNYYLNSMVTTYSLFLPAVSFEDTLSADLRGKLIWLDPASFAVKKYHPTIDDATKTLKAIAFGYDDGTQSVYADIYNFDGSKVTTKSSTTKITNQDFLRNRLADILDYHIIITTTSPDKKGVETANVNPNEYGYFKTKGGGAIRFKKGAANPVTEFANMEVAGGWQIENGAQVKILDRFDMTERARGNGVAYIIDGPLQTSRMSVYDILSDNARYPEFSLFCKLMEATGFFRKALDVDEIDRGSRMIMPYFSSYNYTIYVPKKDSIQAMIDNHVIYDPDVLTDMQVKWNSVDSMLYVATYSGDSTLADIAWRDSMIDFSKTLRGGASYTHADTVFAESVAGGIDGLIENFLNVEKTKIKNFVAYHIQDNSIYINSEFNQGSKNYQTAYLRASDKQFVKLTVDNSSRDGITLIDHKNKVHHVVKDMSGSYPYWNIMCREYEFRNGFGSNSSKGAVSDDVSGIKLETSSYAVIHLIDGPLRNGEVDF